MDGGWGEGVGGYKFLKLFFSELKTFVAKFGENWFLWLRNMTSK